LSPFSFRHEFLSDSLGNDHRATPGTRISRQNPQDLRDLPGNFASSPLKQHPTVEAGHEIQEERPAVGHDQESLRPAYSSRE
jgi:hypothetical protein